MAVDLLPVSPNGEITHGAVREKVNEQIEYTEAIRQDVIDNYVLAAYASIGVNLPTAMATISATPQTITGFDTNLVTAKGVTVDLSNDGLRFTHAGIYTTTIKMAVEFTEVNAGRRLKLQFYNATTATASDSSFNYYVGRNSGGKDIVLPVTFEVSEASIGQLFQLQILSDNDTFTGVSNEGTVWGVAHTSQATFDLGVR